MYPVPTLYDVSPSDSKLSVDLSRTPRSSRKVSSRICETWSRGQTPLLRSQRVLSWISYTRTTAFEHKRNKRSFTGTACHMIDSSSMLSSVIWRGRRWDRRQPPWPSTSQLSHSSLILPNRSLNNSPKLNKPTLLPSPPHSHHMRLLHRNQPRQSCELLIRCHHQPSFHKQWLLFKRILWLSTTNRSPWSHRCHSRCHNRWSREIRTMVAYNTIRMACQSTKHISDTLLCQLTVWSILQLLRLCHHTTKITATVAFPLSQLLHLNKLWVWVLSQLTLRTKRLDCTLPSQITWVSTCTAWCSCHLPTSQGHNLDTQVVALVVTTFTLWLRDLLPTNSEDVVHQFHQESTQWLLQTLLLLVTHMLLTDHQIWDVLSRIL